MSDVVDRLARIETKLDRALLDRDDHEKRLRSVERKSNWLAGLGAAVVAAGGWILQNGMPKL